MLDGPGDVAERTVAEAEVAEVGCLSFNAAQLLAAEGRADLFIGSLSAANVGRSALSCRCRPTRAVRRCSARSSHRLRLLRRCGIAAGVQIFFLGQRSTDLSRLTRAVCASLFSSSTLSSA